MSDNDVIIGSTRRKILIQAGVGRVPMLIGDTSLSRSFSDHGRKNKTRQS